MKRHAWKPVNARSHTGWWLVHRLLPLVLVAAVGGLLVWLLVQPFLHPRIYLMFAAAPYFEAELRAAASPDEDLAAMRAPNLELLAAGATQAGQEAELTSPASLDERLTVLEQREITGRDILLIWLRSQLVSVDGQLELLCGDFDPADERAGRYPLRRLLDRVGRCPARTKLIFLDGGRTAHAPRLGIFAECSPQQIQPLVQDTGDPSLWLYLSHSALQSAHDRAEPRCSAFAFSVGTGLRGEADRNQDRLVALDELVEFVGRQLAADLPDSPSGRRWQTPLLVWGGGPLTPGTAYPLVTPIASGMMTVPGTPPASSLPAGALSRAVPAKLDAAKRGAAKLGAGKAAAQPSGAAATPAGTSPGGSAESPPGPAPQTAVSLVAAGAPELLDLAWSTYRSLADSPLEPRRRAPHLWHALDSHLKNIERACEAEDAPPATVMNDLRRVVLQLQDLTAGNSPPPSGRWDLVPELARWIRAVEPACSPHSLALAEAWASERGQPLPSDVTAVIAGLDTLVAAGSAEEFAKWIAELPARFDAYAECRLARVLGGRPDLSWPAVQRILRVSRLGEKSAAAARGPGSGARAQVDRADRWRLAGERGLLSGIRAADAARAESSLERAAAEYDQALAVSAAAAAVQQAVEQSLFQFPGWIREAVLALSAPAEVPADLAPLSALLDDLDQALQLLAPPSTARLTELRRVQADLKAGLERLASFPPAVAAARSPAESSPVISRDDQQRQLAGIAKLYGRWLRIVAGERFRDEPFPTVAAGTQRLAEAGPGSAESWTACLQLGEELRDFQRRMPALAERWTLENSDLADPAIRPARILRLRDAQRLLYLVHPWDAARLTGPGPAQLLRRAEQYDFLTWQQRRLEAAINDALDGDAGYLAEAADRYRRAAAGIALQPPLAEPARPRLEIAAPQRIALIDVPEQEVLLTVTNRHPGPVDTWLCCDYDPQLLEVLPGLDGRLHDLSADSPAGPFAAAESVAGRPELAGRTPSFRLRSAETGSLRVTIRRRTSTGGAARIAFRAVCDAGMVRRDCDVDLPSTPALELVVDGLPESWQLSENDLILYPFPNRTTPYQLYLVNPGGAARPVDFQLLPASKARLLSPPPGEVAADVAAEYLARVEASAALLGCKELLVPAGGRRLPIPMLPPAAAAGEAKPAAGAEAPAPTPLPPVLLAVCTDSTSGRKMIRRLEILAQRPGRYVEPRVEYDPEIGRVEIVVRPTALLPAGGVSLACTPPPTTDGEIRGRDTALLLPGAAETRLHLEVPPDAGPAFPFTIDVDEFARAFRYDVPTGAAARTVVTASRAVQVRIVEPPADRCFGPEPPAIDVSLQVDIPYAVLRDGVGTLEIGVDADRDRTLQGEESIQVNSDRQVELLLDPAVADGSLGIATRISDLTVTLPPPRLRAGRANLLARAILPNQVVWSEPVEVVFDNEPPQLRQLQLVPGRSLAQGGVLEVSVLASDGELSGVARVEAAFDLDRRGEFTPENAPVPGALQADGRWLISLPTAPVKPGVYQLLVRAADRVGNLSSYQKTRVEVLAAEAAKKPLQTNRLVGRVIFGRLAKTPAKGITVRLVAKDQKVLELLSDEDGQFAFTNVPPGDYRLRAEGLIAGNRRSGEMDLQVPPPPAEVEPIELLLQSGP